VGSSRKTAEGKVNRFFKSPGRRKKKLLVAGTQVERPKPLKQKLKQQLELKREGGLGRGEGLSQKRKTFVQEFAGTEAAKRCRRNGVERDTRSVTCHVECRGISKLEDGR